MRFNAERVLIVLYMQISAAHCIVRLFSTPHLKEHLQFDQSHKHENDSADGGRHRMSESRSAARFTPVSPMKLRVCNCCIFLSALEPRHLCNPCRDHACSVEEPPTLVITIHMPNQNLNSNLQYSTVLSHAMQEQTSHVRASISSQRLTNRSAEGSATK
jgi:hypothetical protein